MTAFSQEEHGMMRGIWGELETLNHTLRDIQGVLERQEQPQGEATDTMAAVKANRRLHGWCLLCGASRRNPGRGCYELSQGLGHSTWAAHSWPKEAPDVLRE